jgi:hypothetical protein
MLKKISWVEDAILSIKIRNDLFSLAQMRKNHIMQFFEISNRDGEWKNIDLNNVSSLFFIFVTENKLKPIIQKIVKENSITPNRHTIPKKMLSLSLMGGGAFGADLIELNDNYTTVEKKIIKPKLSFKSDIDLIYRYELAGMVGDPDKIKSRLIRFFESGINWDDAKSFLFKDIPLPPAQK